MKLSSLGDVVHALPVARALRAWWPRAELTWVVERREQAILEGNPDLDHVVPVDTRLWRREFRRPSGAASVAVKLRGLVRRLARGRFDAAVDLQGLWKSGVITRADAGAAAGRAAGPRSAGSVPAPVHQPARDAAAGGGARGRAVPGRRRRARRGRSAVGPPEFPIPGDPAADAAMARWLEDEGVKPGTAPDALEPGLGRRSQAVGGGGLSPPGRGAGGAPGRRGWRSRGGRARSRSRGRSAHGMRTGALVPPPTTIAEMIALFRRAQPRGRGRHRADPRGRGARRADAGPLRARRARGATAPTGPRATAHPEPHRADGRHLGRDRPGGGRRGCSAEPRRAGCRGSRWPSSP